MDYKVVDVFTNKALKGNPVAVVLDGSGLSTEQMQAIARWTNLSETTFVVPVTEQGADYHVRIFAPTDELPFAGHPSLGTAHAVMEAGLVPRKPQLVQQCKRGLIQINVSDDAIEFGLEVQESQELTAQETQALSQIFPTLTISSTRAPMLVNSGPKWIVVEVEDSAERLLEVKPDAEAINTLAKPLNNASGICIYAPHSSGDGNIELRTFAPPVTVYEDPVCGSGNAAVAFYRNLGRKYTARQGSALFRDGIISVSYGDGKVWIGGPTVTVVDGKISL